MMGEREITEAEVPRDIGEGASKLFFGLQFANVPDKCLYTIEHPPLRLCRGSGEGVPSHLIPAGALSTECRTFVSQAKDAAQGPSEATNDEVGARVQIYSFVSNLFDKSFVARGELEVVLCRPRRNDPRKAAGTVRRLSDRFADAAGSCTDLPQLGALLDDAARELGFHYFALLDHSEFDRRLHRIGAGRQLSRTLG